MLDRPSTTDTQTATPTGFVDYVLPTLLSWREQGIASALVTVVGVDGSSPRPVGSQMAVAIDGSYVGQISSGCAEQAIVEEAVACLKAGCNRTVRYGKGSPYLDIVLPCGSGIDLFFDSSIATQDIAQIVNRCRERKQITQAFDLDICESRVLSDAEIASDRTLQLSLAPDTWQAGQIVFKRFTPQIRLLALGRGTIVGALTQMCDVLGWATHAFAPDESTLTYATESGALSATHLTRPDDVPAALADLTDPWTAAILMFHDHEWEPLLLNGLLTSDCFYIGAIGSRRTHSQRVEALRDMGQTDGALARIQGPVGLDIGAQTPPEIALAITAEILQRIRQG